MFTVDERDAVLAVETEALSFATSGDLMTQGSGRRHWILANALGKVMDILMTEGESETTSDDALKGAFERLQAKPAFGVQVAPEKPLEPAAAPVTAQADTTAADASMKAAQADAAANFNH
jgi:hypothetical protein